jgi:hypothetical protein
MGYIDPGSGSLIVQAFIATVIAVPFFFRQQIGRVARSVRREPVHQASTSADPRVGPRKPDV